MNIGTPQRVVEVQPSELDVPPAAAPEPREDEEKRPEPREREREKVGVPA